MKTKTGALQAAIVAVLALMLSPRVRSEEAASPSPATSEHVEVTATRIPEDVDTVPASITIVTAQELRDRGVRDLRGALELAAGIDISPGGDGGPAASVPEIWGLREFDAFLLVVDGVPWGGAFNPALATLDLTDVERIEVLRGAAPVMYGATSFVGVIQIIRRAPGEKGGRIAASGGSFGSGSIAARSALPQLGALRSSFAASVEREGFKDDRTQFDRGHVLWRGGIAVGGGNLRLDIDGTWLRQDPASPHPSEEVRPEVFELSPEVPLDANHNPHDAHLNERRWFFAGGYDHPALGGEWSTTLSATKSHTGILRGFLVEPEDVDPNANAIRESIDTTDVYFDTHWAWTHEAEGRPALRVVAGLDHLYGRGRARGGDFDYFVDLEGDEPDVSGIENASHALIHDTRNFSGLYAFVEWNPWEAWRFEIGGRVNRTKEERDASIVELDTGDREGGTDERTTTRGSGAAGITWTPYHDGEDALHVYANYRNTFKPAAIDFGLEAEGEILKPETAKSIEIGAKSRFCGGRAEAELSAFRMNFENLVVAESGMGTPGLQNEGMIRFQGIEADVEWRVQDALWWRTTYALHDARFREGEFVDDMGGTVELKGKHREMSPRYQASMGLVYAPKTGWTASATAGYVGSRFLNRENNGHAKAYTTWSAGFGYRRETWEVRVDGTNLNDRRDPVTESELGQEQFYRLPARHITLSGAWNF